MSLKDVRVMKTFDRLSCLKILNESSQSIFKIWRRRRKEKLEKNPWLTK